MILKSAVGALPTANIFMFLSTAFSMKKDPKTGLIKKAH
jgi:hypothetical protein